MEHFLHGSRACSNGGQMIQIGIGTQANQYIGQKVLEYTIRKHTKEAVDIRYPKQIAKRKGGTKFGFVRFQLPELFGFKGRAIYMDADQLVFADVRELVDTLDSDHAIGIVRNIYGTFAGKPVAERNETSVMVLDCEKLVDWKTDTIFENVVPNSAELQPGQIMDQVDARSQGARFREDQRHAEVCRPTSHPSTLRPLCISLEPFS